MEDVRTGHPPLIEGAQVEPRSILEIVDGSFRLYRRHFLFLVAVAAVPNMLLAPLFLIPGSWLQQWAEGETSGPGVFFVQFAVAVVLSGIVTSLQVILTMVLEAAAMRTLADGEGPSLRGCLRRVFHRARSVAGATVLHFLAALVLAAVSCVFCGIPILSFLYGVFFCLFAQVIFFEERGAISATVRGFRLIAPDFFRALVLLFLTFVVFGYVLEGVLTLPIQVLAFVREGLTGSTGGAYLGLVGAATGVAHALVWPLLASALTLLYYDTLARREGLDLRARCRERGIPVPAGGAPRTASTAA